MNIENDSLTDYFSRLVKNNFNDPSVQKAGFQGRGDVTFYYLEYNGATYVIKKFPSVRLRQDSSGAESLDFTGRNLFERELCALESLKQTDRVCPVLFSSRQLPQYGEGDFKGPYFIVKKELQGLLNHPPPGLLKLLELGAQQADISDRFLRQGWRDLDGNPSNDALAEGKIKRIDLDGAHPVWAVAERFNGMYQAPRYVGICRDMDLRHAELMQEEAEIESLTIRISRLLLPEQENPWGLINQILSVKYRGHLLSRMQRFNNYRIQKLHRKWLNRWSPENKQRGPSANEYISPYKLSTTETRFLAYLLFQLLSSRNHGMTLRDIYFSLMLLDLAILQQKYRVATSNDHRKMLEQMEGIVSGLYELDNFIKAEEPPAEETPGNDEEHDEPPSPVKTLFELELTFSGGAWKGRKKGIDRKGDDIVILPRSKDVPILLLADGASRAGGTAAVQIIQEVYEKWVRDVGAKNPNDCAKVVRSLVADIHKTLLERVDSSGKECESTLVVIAVIYDPENPSVLFTRYGNSGYLVTYEDPAEGGDELIYTLKSSSSGSHVMLGSTALDLSRVRFDTQPLTREGVYRVRAYSDGIANKDDEAYERLDEKICITELVKQAENWDENFHEVGDDDWSVAGCDIVVRKKEAPAPAQETRSQEQKPEVKEKNSLEKLALVDPTKFRLSRAAANFWHGALAMNSFKTLRDYPLIKDVLGLHPPDMSALEIKDRAAGKDAEAHFTPRQLIITAAVVIFLIIVILALSIVSNRPRVAQLIMNDEPITPTPTPTRGLPNLSPGALAIYQELTSKREAVRDNLPPNSGVDGEPLKSYISYLKELRDKTNLRLRIEVHTDLTGSVNLISRSQQNQETSDLRAGRIREQLSGPGGSSGDRFEVVGRGEELPVIREIGTEANGMNRRLVITPQPR